jgi:non-specific serine/threonine protein kinase
MTYEQFQQRYQYNPSTDLLTEKGNISIYKAYDVYFDIWVIIKKSKVSMLSSQSYSLKEEATLLDSLPLHANIIHYSDYYTFSLLGDSYDFAISQYYELGNLEDSIQKHDISFGIKESILQQLLDGIEFLHSQGIIHGSLIPTHILLDYDGGYIPKISHFSHSASIMDNDSTILMNIFQEEAVNYVSPEQLNGKKLTFASDLWSFGVMACWLLTGKLPFDSDGYDSNNLIGRLEILKRINVGELPSFIDELPYHWSVIIKRCLVRNPDERIKSVQECREIMEDIKNERLRSIKDVRGKWGFVNRKGVLAIPCIYDEVYIYGKIIRVKLNEKYGFINNIGKEITSIKYEEVNAVYDDIDEINSKLRMDSSKI